MMACASFSKSYIHPFIFVTRQGTHPWALQVKGVSFLQIFTEHFAQTQKNIASFQCLMDPSQLSPKLITDLDTKQASTETRKLKLPESYLSTTD